MGDLYAGNLAGLPAPLLMAAAAMAGWTLFGRHRLGRRLVAVGSSPAAAFQAGVPVRRVKLLAYVAAWVLVACPPSRSRRRRCRGMPSSDSPTP